MSAGYNATQRELEILELRKENTRLRDALTRISNGGTSVLISALLDECPVNPEVLEQIVKDAVAALSPAHSVGEAQ